jgi:hypothetical protein
MEFNKIDWSIRGLITVEDISAVWSDTNVKKARFGLNNIQNSD